MREFRAGGIVDPTRHAHVGRGFSRSLAEIAKRPELVWVWGPPRSGKTSLLDEAHRAVSGDSDASARSAFVSCEGVNRRQGDRHFIERLLQRIRDGLGLDKPTASNDDVSTPDRLANDIAAMSVQLSEVRPVVFLDEVNLLYRELGSSSADAIVDKFIDAVEHHGWSVALCAVFHSGDLVERTGTVRRLQRARHIEVGYLEEPGRASFEATFAERPGVTVERARELVDLLWRETEGHPFYTQRIAALLTLADLGVGEAAHVIEVAVQRALIEEQRDPMRGVLKTTSTMLASLDSRTRSGALGEYLILLATHELYRTIPGAQHGRYPDSMDRLLVTLGLARMGEEVLVPPPAIVRRFFTPEWGKAQLEETRPGWGAAMYRWLVKGPQFVPAHAERAELVAALRAEHELSSEEQRFLRVLVEANERDDRAQRERLEIERRAALAETERARLAEEVAVREAAAARARTRFLFLAATLALLVVTGAAYITNTEAARGARELALDELLTKSQFAGCDAVRPDDPPGIDPELARAYGVARTVCVSAEAQMSAAVGRVASALEQPPPASCAHAWDEQCWSDLSASARLLSGRPESCPECPCEDSPPGD